MILQVVASAVLLLLATCLPLHAQIYNFNATVTLSMGYSVSNQTTNAAVFVPEGVTEPLGAIIVWNSDGEDRRYMTAVGWFQHSARATNSGIIACNTVFSWGYHISATQNNILNLLSDAASASGRPNLVNAPVFVLGNSRGAFTSIRSARHFPSRNLGFAARKGLDEDFWWEPGDPPSPADGSYSPSRFLVPGIWVPGETETGPSVGSFDVQNSFMQWRAQGALNAFALDYNIGHSDRDGQFHDLAAVLLREVHALRHPGTPPSSIPGNPLTLNTLSYSSGWLGERPLIWQPASLTGFTAGKVVVRSRFPQIAPVANLPGNASEASWLPSQTMALVYQAAQSTDAFHIGRNESPRQGPLQIETPSRFQRFRTTDPIRISVDPREWADVTKGEFYLNSTKLGEKTNGSWTWDVATTVPQNPSVWGLRLLPAAETNPFSITGSKQLPVGRIGIINLDANTSTLNNAQFFLNGSQIGDAAAGPLVLSKSGNFPTANSNHVLAQAASITVAPEPVTAPPGFAAAAAVISKQLMVNLGSSLWPLEQRRPMHLGSPANPTPSHRLRQTRLHPPPLPAAAGDLGQPLNMPI